MTFILPESDDDLLAECDVTTFRAGGPGGQHQNKTDSAARLMHRPSGIVVVCRSERSQFVNKQIALKRLREKAAALNYKAPPRRPTKATKASKERRLQEKSRRSGIKKDRKMPPSDA